MQPRWMAACAALIVALACSKKSPPPAPTAAPVTAGAPLPASVSTCLACELKASHDPTGCPNTSPTAKLGTNDPAKFGCDGFPPAERGRCKALLACLKAKGCARGGDPTPCLCGDMDAPTCASKPVASLPGACRDEYVAAVAGRDLYTLFFSTDSPVGVANNLYACDVETPCPCP